MAPSTRSIAERSSLRDAFPAHSHDFDQIKEEYNHQRTHYTYPQPLAPKAAPVPGSKSNRQGGSKFNRRGHSGIVLWSGVYDSGIQIYDPPPGPFSWARESRLDGLTRLTHQTAYRLMQQITRDVGEWQRNERLRERAL